MQKFLIKLNDTNIAYLVTASNGLLAAMAFIHYVTHLELVDYEITIHNVSIVSPEPGEAYKEITACPSCGGLGWHLDAGATPCDTCQKTGVENAHWIDKLPQLPAVSEKNRVAQTIKKSQSEDQLN